MGIRPDARTLRDMAARHAVHSNELLRQAYKYIARNTTLPSRVRHMAQLELNSFPNRARPTVVKDRCIETGRGRGILTDFGLCRYQFRQKALAGQLPGVEKASW
ncbi:40S ribosomal protein mrp2, mitochondrial [Malassezia obtusa]|uniref:40S ribosomal protein mrp2, mitochondrial n=1 Tax=Malassezia obtusa TaxID=76774 RepID=A0AAF0ITY0_9BASI|nr:40S ribosomal protein mrp2, mitochondrial [Malassezia obtusa]